MGLDKSDISLMLSKLKGDQKVFASSEGEIFPVYGVILKDSLIEIQVGWAPISGLREVDMNEVTTIKDFLLKIDSSHLEGVSKVRCSIQSNRVSVKGIKPIYDSGRMAVRSCVLLC